MATNRQFCRFNKGESTSTGKIDRSGLTTRVIPDGGFCLSSFLVLSDSTRSGTVLMGHLDPLALWDHIGALDDKRIEINRKGWMLPSCHLMLFESPLDAATRVAREQLGIDHDLKLSGPTVVSEIWTPKRFPDLEHHWDIEFIYKGILKMEILNAQHAWVDLQFLDPSKIEKSSIARSHEDILVSAGFKLAE